MRTRKYSFYFDASHGWLRVKRREILELGLVDTISRYSYMDKRYAYLEEDCDASLFLSKLKEMQTPYTIIEKDHGNISSIRSMEIYDRSAIRGC